MAKRLTLASVPPEIPQDDDPSKPTPPKKLRSYQLKAVETIGSSSAIVKLPTGSGKTLIAAEIVKRNLSAQQEQSPHNNNNPQQQQQQQRRRKSALFLVPTCHLVDQQSATLSEWCTDRRIVRFRGGIKMPSDDFDILVSTPAAFLLLQQRHHHQQQQQQRSNDGGEIYPSSSSSSTTTFGWDSFSVVVFDEVHHVLKDHPYRKIALSVPKRNDIQILGLSASLTYAVDEREVTTVLKKISRELGVETMISPDDDELMEGGYYHASRCHDDDDDDDDGGIVEIMPSRIVPEGVLPKERRQPHAAYLAFFQRARRGEATVFSTLYYEVILELERQAKQMDESFASPLTEVKLTSWEDYAHKRFLAVTSNTQTISREVHRFLFFLQQLEVWYVGLRMLVLSWEEDEEMVLFWLKIQEGFEEIDPEWNQELRDSIAKMRRFVHEFDFSRLNMLRDQMISKRRRFGKELRGIIFVQQRITAYIISHFLNMDEECRTALDIRSGFVTSKGSRITPSIKVTPTYLKNTLDDFRNGKINVIVATSVIEEGFDVPEANLVISFDHLNNSVELCQRFGRARRDDCAIVVMDERKDRTIEKLQLVRKQQDFIIDNFDPSSEEKMPNDSRAKDDDVVVHKNLERAAATRILCDSNKCTNEPASSLHNYAQKTRATLEEFFSRDEDDNNNGVLFRCELTYNSALRIVRTRGVGQSKKIAKNQGSFALLMELKRLTCGES